MLKINKRLAIIPLIILLVMSVVLVVCYFFIWKEPTPQDVFVNSQSSIVELKSQTGEDIISYGSAVFIKDDGTLISNAHMVAYKQAGVYKEFESYEIRFSFEKEYRAVTLIKYDLSLDLSVLKLDEINGVNFKKIKTGDSSKIASGDKVYAIGNGMNHGIGITNGLISLPQVNIDYEDNIRNVIQCDLVINEGNSGGALLDDRGKLIGITSFRLKDNSGNVIYGIAFCIPVNIVFDYLNL